MRARHMCDIKYQSILANLNYKYNEDTSVAKWRYTANEILGAEDKCFQWTLGGKRVKNQVSSSLKDAFFFYNTIFIYKTALDKVLFQKNNTAAKIAYLLAVLFLNLEKCTFCWKWNKRSIIFSCGLLRV